MPELTNISVGSLRGTSGEAATALCPFFSKKDRKEDLMSFTLCMAKARSQEKGGKSRRGKSETPSIAGVAGMSSIAPSPGPDLAHQADAASEALDRHSR